MLTKRDALLLLAMMPLGQAKAGELDAGGGFVVFDPNAPVTWSFGLDRVKEFVVERNGKQITISADAVWEALGGTE